MEIKKKIFIGSSVESNDIANSVKTLLANEYECVVWNEGFFEYGHHYSTDLIQKILTFDYAILIGGKDDLVTRISNGTVKTSPRDNIYLEYGLFSGILSPNRVLLLIDNSCTVASDLAGMTLGQYDNIESAKNFVKKWLTVQKQSTKRLGNDIELLPTSGIAVGYYYNFIVPFINNIVDMQRKGLWEYKDFSLEIFIPNFISNDVNAYKMLLQYKKKLNDDLVGKYRIMTKTDSDNNLLMFDVPSNILSLFKTVDYIFKTMQNDTEDTLRVKVRALDNFTDNLNTLINGDAFMSQIIKVHRFDNKCE